jgi:deoxyribodipyrimidine photo-lyase
MIYLKIYVYTKMKNVLFIFHRDLRVVDHPPLQAALDHAARLGGSVIPIFVFESAQIGRGSPAVACLTRSVQELASAIREIGGHLNIFYGQTDKNVANAVIQYNIAAVYETRDYTPYAVARSKRTAAAIGDSEYNCIDDLYLFAPGTILNKSGRPFQKFTPFYEAALKLTVPRPAGTVHGPFRRTAIAGTEPIRSVAISGLRYNGGRKEGVQLLKKIPRDYAERHDILVKETSGLSVHHRNGTVSVRESWWAGAGLDAFQRQLLWRDFYGHLVAAWDELYGERYGDLHSWLIERPSLSDRRAAQFDAWCRGETGIPLVDAAMRQLNETGFMHNRGRLVVASVLGRDWGVPWQWGAGYFAKKLVDYDYVQNTMNWLHVVEHFPFSQAPFRRHDPERTAARLDPHGEYISRWSS